MGCTLYMPSAGAAAVSPTPSATDWDGHINNVSRPLEFVNSGSAMTSLAYAPDAADHLTNVATMIAQFVSEILPPQVVAAQQIAIGARTLEPVATNNLFLAWKLYAVNVDGSASLGNIVAWRNASGAPSAEFGTALSGRGEIVAGSALTLNEPWRLVLEIGADGLPTVSASVDGHNFTIAFGSPFATGALSLCQEGDTGVCPAMLIMEDGLVRLPLGEAALALGI